MHHGRHQAAVSSNLRLHAHHTPVSWRSRHVLSCVVHAPLVLPRSFFDTTKTGEITSRLSADTTTVSDQICLNLNVMLRSATQVRGGVWVGGWLQGGCP